MRHYGPPITPDYALGFAESYVNMISNCVSTQCMRQPELRACSASRSGDWSVWILAYILIKLEIVTAGNWKADMFVQA